MKPRVRYGDAVERVALGHHLRQWPWTLAGTPPLGIDVPGSDIDVVCSVDDYDGFATALWQAFAQFDGFCLWQWIGSGHPIVARFFAEGWTFEVFGSKAKLRDQKAVRHFAVEKRLLALAGDDFREAVLASKEAGHKTEPAFALLLGLSGDPYDALLSIGRADDADLSALLSSTGFTVRTNGKIPHAETH